MNVVLIGYRGTGKSTVARVLGQRLGWPVVSTDALIVAKLNLSIPDIVARFGWEYFRDVEAGVCREVTSQDRQVIDTGGGVVLRHDNVSALRTGGVTFWLTAEVPTIVSRIGEDTQRPSLTGAKSFVEEIEEVLRARQPCYRAAADHLIPTDRLSPEEVAGRILAALPDR